mmetsp:Transcript_35125/g.113278  ORF Transcript_35125/g.113278 Transcript_35125/m.113278 type:complete len:355 (-) Transcript_35125:285-1349(-)
MGLGRGKRRRRGRTRCRLGRRRLRREDRVEGGVAVSSPAAAAKARLADGRHRGGGRGLVGSRRRRQRVVSPVGKRRVEARERRAVRGGRLPKRVHRGRAPKGIRQGRVRKPVRGGVRVRKGGLFPLGGVAHQPSDVLLANLVPRDAVLERGASPHQRVRGRLPAAPLPGGGDAPSGRPLRRRSLRRHTFRRALVRPARRGVAASVGGCVVAERGKGVGPKVCRGAEEVGVRGRRGEGLLLAAHLYQHRRGEVGLRRRRPRTARLPLPPGAQLDLHRRRQERRGMGLRPEAPARHKHPCGGRRGGPHPPARYRGPVLLCHHTARGQARRLPRQQRWSVQDECHGRGRDRRQRGHV